MFGRKDKKDDQKYAGGQALSEAAARASGDAHVRAHRTTYIAHLVVALLFVAGGVAVALSGSGPQDGEVSASPLTGVKYRGGVALAIIALGAISMATLPELRVGMSAADAERDKRKWMFGGVGIGVALGALIMGLVWAVAT